MTSFPEVTAWRNEEGQEEGEAPAARAGPRGAKGALGRRGRWGEPASPRTSRWPCWVRMRVRASEAATLHMSERPDLPLWVEKGVIEGTCSILGARCIGSDS